MNSSPFSSLLSVILLTLIAAPTRAADQTLAPLSKMTAAEAADTILPSGVICRITDAIGDVRVGDGTTRGGQSIGDGVGWEEGSPLTQDLNTDGHAVNLGDGWAVNMLGGWGALSGPGELSASADQLNLSVYGSVMLSASSALSSAHLGISYDGTYLNLTTPITDTQPVIQYAPDLISQDWQPAPVSSITTNATTYTYNIDPAQFDDYAYFRAMLASGTGSTVTIHADTLAVPGAITNPALDAALAEVAANSLATASLTSDLSSLTSDLSEALTTQALIFHGTVGTTNRTATLSWDFDNNVFAVEVTDD